MLQLYVATSSNSTPVGVATLPFAGFDRAPHDTGSHTSAVPVHDQAVPLQVWVFAVPERRVYPVSQLNVAVDPVVAPGTETVAFATVATVPQLVGAQLGALPDHAPDASHVRVAAPVTAYPAPQLYVAEAPNNVPAAVVTLPLSGAVSGPQSTASQVAPSDQVPSPPQMTRYVVSELPLTRYPSSQA